MGQLNIYNLGKLGVNVDKSPIHLEDGELTSAQNAVPDKHGADGALCKRWGLVKHAASVAAGSILGFLGAPLGSGPGTGTDDATSYYLGQVGGTYVASTDSFSSRTATSVIAAPVNTVVSVMLNGKMFYASGTTLRVFDGVKDALFCNLGESPLFVGALRGLIYVSTTSGFVYEVDAVGRLERVGAALPGSYLPGALVYHQNDLYAACSKAGSVSTLYRIRRNVATSATAWTLDFSSVVVDTAIGNMASFKGLLYMVTNTPNTTASIVYQRSAAGVHTAVDTGGVSSGANDITVFKGKLYVHWDHGSTNDSLIRRTSDGTSWATVLTYTPVGDAGGIAAFFNTGSKLFAVGYPQSIGQYSADGASWTQFSGGATLEPVFGYFRASGSGPAFGSTASFIVMQAASSLQLLNTAGTLATLALPTGVALDVLRPPRFAIYNKQVVVVNTPSRPITVDGEGVVRMLCPLPPTRALGVAATGGAGALTGDYLVLQTYRILDAAGNVLAESDFSPFMETAFTAAAKTLNATGVNLSPEDITQSRLYRTTAGGTTYFPWIDIDGNALTTSVSDDQTDASLSLIAAPTLGTVPNLSLIGAYKGRLFGVDRADVDYLVYSEAGLGYAWPNTNRIPIGMLGSDIRGITAIIVRRDAIGVGRRNGLFQVSGNSTSNFQPVTLGENLSVESQETVKVWKDIAYFLGTDGVYAWGPEGVRCITDNKTGSWFTTDTYFNRARFQYAFSTIDPVNGRYRLYLAAAGSSSEDRWVEYDIADGTWWGPHKTAAFSPTAADQTTNSSGTKFALVASSSGYLWKDQSTRTDDTATAIDLSVDTKRHDGQTPAIDKMFGPLTVVNMPQTKGRLLVTPSVGDMDAAASSQSLRADLTKGSQLLGQVGVGSTCSLNFREATNSHNVQLIGYELPFFELGTRK